MRILQVSTSDGAGGAAGIARQLAREYRRRGHVSMFAVGDVQTSEPGVVRIDNDDRGAWARAWQRADMLLERYDGRVGGAGRLHQATFALGQPRRWAALRHGKEDFDHPGARRLLTLTPSPPDVVHAHNLHGGYFDLRELPRLSRAAPFMITLHDAWLLSGHCAHSFDCGRWETGCGNCPDLTIYPAIRRDNTAANWQRKREVLKNSRLHVATPSEWLMRRVERSIVADGAEELRVIPNGVDMATFRPASRTAARVELGLAPHARVVIFAANGIRNNRWKDFRTLRAALAAVADEELTLLAVGEDSADEDLRGSTIRFARADGPGRMARYYQAADIYAHAAHVDTFPNTVLEALACGIPVVATAVGGIPEQIRDGETGLLVPKSDPAALGEALGALVRDPARARAMGAAATADAERRFTLRRQAEEYLAWYERVLDGAASETQSADAAPLETRTG